MKKTMSMLVRFEKWFNRNFGWFFTNGYKSAMGKSAEAPASTI